MAGIKCQGTRLTCSRAGAENQSANGFFSHKSLMNIFTSKLTAIDFTKQCLMVLKNTKISSRTCNPCNSLGIHDKEIKLNVSLAGAESGGH